MMRRLAIFTTHPIQYQAPWFRALAAERDIDLEVVFSHLPTAHEQGVGFNKAFEWDVPLLEGYRWRLMKTRVLTTSVHAFVRRWALDLDDIIKSFAPDAAIILGWQDVSLVQALFACRRYGVPVVLRGESNNLRTRSSIISFVHRLYFRACDGFLAIGQANAALYENAGVSSKRIIMAKYFVENSRFDSDANRLRAERGAIRESYDIPHGRTCFAFVGKFETKKRPLDVIRGLRIALDSGADVCGLFVGDGELFTEIQSLSIELNVPVTFAGFLNQSEIARAYVAADALVLPSDFGETWGLVVNEAMASGLPAIVSDRIGSAHDLVVHNETGYVVPFGDPLAIANAMLELAAEPEKRLKLGRQAQDRVFRDYSISQAVKATKQLLEVIGNRK